MSYNIGAMSKWRIKLLVGKLKWVTPNGFCVLTQEDVDHTARLVDMVLSYAGKVYRNVRTIPQDRIPSVSNLTERHFMDLVRVCTPTGFNYMHNLISSRMKSMPPFYETVDDRRTQGDVAHVDAGGMTERDSAFAYAMFIFATPGYYVNHSNVAGGGSFRVFHYTPFINWDGQAYRYWDAPKGNYNVLVDMCNPNTGTGVVVIAYRHAPSKLNASRPILQHMTWLGTWAKHFVYP